MLAVPGLSKLGHPKPLTCARGDAFVDPIYRSLWRGLVAAIPMTEGGGAPYDLVSGRPLALNGALSWVVGRGGRGMLGTAGSAFLHFPLNPILPQDTPFSMLTVCEPQADLTTSHPIMSLRDSGFSRSNAHHWRGDQVGDPIWGTVTTPAGGDTTLTFNSPYVLGRPDHLVSTWDRATYRLYWNGTLAASAAQTSVRVLADALILSDGGTSAGGPVYLAAIWRRALGAGEIALLVQDPYGFVRLARRRRAFTSVFQEVAPISTVAADGWLNELGSAVNLHLSVDEDTPSDVDYIVSPTDPQDAVAKLGLGDPGLPVAGDWKLRVRYRKQ